MRPIAADRLLRRADWCWLLPEGRVARVICLATDDLCASARVVADDATACGTIRGVERVDIASVSTRDGQYDLALATNCDASTLSRARQALRAEGALYVECGARTVGGVKRLERRLHAAGFGDVQRVMRWDASDADRAWLPLDSARALRHYFLRHHVSARHPMRRFWLLMQRRAALVLVAGGWLPRGTVLIARAVDTRRSLRAPQGKAANRGTVPWWVGAASRLLAEPASNDWLLLTPGSNAEAKAVGLVLDRAAKWPRAAVKLGRTGETMARCERGLRALERLREYGVTALGHAPEPVGRLVDAHGRLRGTVESAVSGRRLDTAVRSDTVSRLTVETTDWLTALAIATRGPPRDDAWERLLRPTVDRFRDGAGGLVDSALCEEAVALLAGVKSLPTVFEHHDCRPWNIYRTRDHRLVAFDWDNARPHGLPAFDLLQCHAYLAFAVDGTLATGRYAWSHRRAEAGRLGGVRRACRARYADAVGLDDYAMRAMRAFVWMRLCADEVEVRRAGGAPLARSDVAQSLLGLWEAEARAALA
ncbi:hypothetical protein J421_5775 (plasmid) [Gemmatirosa kalamazoonensis]|uniref:Uncharacterized protein n=2 Tax=Gemmatirosa kalamazoonensis TaxID=861299 RepID=W0RSM7_9BACT|nr:hypothetical protein J421_5775 [Gemmatirosa kalamazoonensis]